MAAAAAPGRVAPSEEEAAVPRTVETAVERPDTAAVEAAEPAEESPRVEEWKGPAAAAVGAAARRRPVLANWRAFRTVRRRVR